MFLTRHFVPHCFSPLGSACNLLQSQENTEDKASAVIGILHIASVPLCLVLRQSSVLQAQLVRAQNCMVGYSFCLFCCCLGAFMLRHD